ncbi:MAG: dihydroorotase [Butyrivibrio sp.]|nr:dihydroorotase [Butyrivibrio sp.]
MDLIRNGYMIDPASGIEGKRDILIEEGKIKCITEHYEGEAANIIDAEGLVVAPGLVDGHVHFRDPGFTYKEDIYTGAAASARGGFTSVIMMGNTEPHMDNPDTLKYVLDKGKSTGIKVYACANVTKDMQGKELVNMQEMIDAGAVLFTDDGKPVMSEEIMRKACENAAKVRKIISLHEEDPKLITDNGINAGPVAEKMGITGSPRQAEISMVERDIKIAMETGAEITIQHISAAESVELIRQARKTYKGIHAEATPHHFTLTQEAVLKYGAMAKMNPPLREESDRQAIIQGLKDGTIETIATDHAPHASYEKEKGLREAPSGIIGIETSLGLGVRELVEPGYLTLKELLERMTVGPARLYGLLAGELKEGADADIVIFNPKERAKYTSSLSKSSNTPFLGQEIPAVIYYTICKGKIIYSKY